MAEFDQSFTSFQQWVNKASSWLTRHPDYDPKRGFRAICYDTKGRQCRNGGDFMRARDEDAFPVRWLWPDQIAEIAASPAGHALTPAGRRPTPGGQDASEAERIGRTAMKAEPTKARPWRMTKTQRIILEAAAETGTVQMGAGDRKGTRIIGRDRTMGTPVVRAYANPEWVLLRRGAIEKGNAPFVFRITPLGRQALAEARERENGNG